MKEYIEKEAVLEILKRNSVGTWRGVPAYPAEIKSAAHEIGNLPAADVAEVRHGRWILEREPDGTPYCFHCSVCDNDFHHIGIMTATDYCPNCGARMGKEAEHETD